MASYIPFKAASKTSNLSFSWPIRIPFPPNHPINGHTHHFKPTTTANGSGVAAPVIARTTSSAFSLLVNTCSHRTGSQKGQSYWPSASTKKQAANAAQLTLLLHLKRTTAEIASL